MEALSEAGVLDIYYGDESRVSLEPCVPYAWQFKDENIAIPSERGGGRNCFALLSRDNRCHFRTTKERITAAWVREELERFSQSVQVSGRHAVVVLDNARVHGAKLVQARMTAWQERGLFILFLPPYSPHLNITETLWRKLKYEWLRPEDYADEETLHYAVWKALAAVGTELSIKFADFNHAKYSAT